LTPEEIIAEEAPMNWIEAWFDFAPDGGDSSLELLLVMVAAALIGISGAWMYPRTRSILIRLFLPLGRIIQR